MKRLRFIQFRVEQSTRPASVDSERLRRSPETGADFPRRIDHYIDYFGDGGGGAMRPSRRIDALDGVGTVAAAHVLVAVRPPRMT